VTARVLRLGGGGIIDCEYDPQAGVAVNKRCTFEWVPGRNKYVIKSVFNPPQELLTPDQNRAAFELSPPSGLSHSNAVPNCILALWNVPPQRAVAFEVQINTSASEEGADSYFTRAGG